MRMNAASDSGDELIRQSASLLMSNQTTHLMSGKFVRRVGMISSIHLALSPAHLSGGHLPNHDRLFPGCQEGIDFLENLSESLPAAILSTPVVSIDAGPIDVGIAG